jgi:hypothetical protein
MSSRADIIVAQTAGTSQFTGGGRNYLVQTPAGKFYLFFKTPAGYLHYRTSVNGLVWSDSVAIDEGVTLTAISIWYDRWSGIDADLVHLAYIDSTADDVFYKNINLADNSQSGRTVIFAGASTASGGCLSIARAIGGNIGCHFSIDAGAEDGFAKSTNVGASWAAAADSSEAVTGDQVILLPGHAVDTQDMMLIFWDASANEISYKLYDNSADSWAESSISTGMTDATPSTVLPMFSATVDLVNSLNILVAWSINNNNAAVLKCWTLTESAITEKTSPVADGNANQSMALVTLDTATGHWWVFYAGTEAGTDGYATTLQTYCKCSQDGGSTWGPERLLSTYGKTWFLHMLVAPRYFGALPPPYLWLMRTNVADFRINLELPIRKTNLILGM